jgi:hypothetical protein
MSNGTPFATMPGKGLDALRPNTGRGVPGSGSYNPSHDSTKRGAPSFSHGKVRRDETAGMFQNTPAPNYYETK